MKMSYFGYSIEHHTDQIEFLYDMRLFLRAFCQFDDSDYKNQFTHLGEHIYLLHVAGGLFLFIITRDQEIIKRINTNDLTVTDIREMLRRRHESIGFASYVYICSNYFGFASTVMAPRCGTFCGFIDRIFQSVGLSDFRFKPHPMMIQATRNEALQMEIMGETTFRVDKASTTAEHVKQMFGLNDDDFLNLASIEIKLKPMPRRNIRPAASRIIQQLPNDGLERFIVKAKSEAGGTLQELFLADMGQLSDSIENRDEAALRDQIREKVQGNDVLQQKVNEHARNDAFTEVEARDINELCDVDAWADRVLGLYPDG